MATQTVAATVKKLLEDMQAGAIRQEEMRTTQAARTKERQAAEEARAISQEARAKKQMQRTIRMALWEANLKIAVTMGDTAAIRALGVEAKSFD